MTQTAQKAPLKTSGSLVNFILGNNATAPVAGAGATILRYTDRHAYEVLEVSKCGKRCTIQRYLPKRVPDTPAPYMETELQKYVYDELVGKPIEIAYRHGAWRRKYITIAFNPNFQDYDTAPPTHERWCEYFLPLQDDSGNYKLVEGKTYAELNWEKISIIFGVRQEYYDYSF